jgi:MFS family permease
VDLGPHRCACARGDRRAALNVERRFAAYLVATATADAGYWIAQIAQGWLVLKLTNSPLWLGLISAASQLPYLLFSLAGGDLADRFERRRVVALANIAIACVALTAAALVAFGWITIGWLAVLGFLGGTIVALEHPVDRAWIYDLVEGRGLGRAIALGALEWATARTVGPAIGGTAIATFGIAAGYTGYAICVLPLIALALCVRTRNSRGGSRDATRDPRRAMRAIVGFSAFTAFFTIGVSPYQALLPDIAQNVFGADAARYGMMAAAGGIGAIAGALWLSLRGGVARPARAATIAAFLGASLLTAFVHTAAFIPALALLAAMGMVDTLMYALANTYVQQIAGDDDRGRANAIFSLAFLGGAPLGNALLGVLAGRFGTTTALASSSLIVALASIAFWFVFRAERDAA